MYLSITVRELIDNPHLKTRLIAGNEGINNEITWAHACELDDPSNWLIGGELVMTNGIAIPSSPLKQVAYLKKLIKSRAGGLAISKDLHAPPLSKELLEFADKNGFPILLTDYEIPWIALSKTVAVTNANQDYARVLLVMKLYNLLHQSIYDLETHNLIKLISTTINANIQVLDDRNKNVLFKSSSNNSSEKKPLKDGIDEEHFFLRVKVPSSRPVHLLIDSMEQETMDTLVINHLSTIVGLFIERDVANYERRRRQGTEILLGLIEDQYSDEVVPMLLTEHQLNLQDLFLIACAIEEDEFNSSSLHIALYEQNIPNILAFKDNKLLVLLPADEAALEKLRKELLQKLHIGVSKSIKGNIKIKKMYKEVVWALRSAETLNKQIEFYNESLSISPFLPNGQIEARELVYGILGGLIDYDTNHQGNLIRTLYVFLSENQSWKATSEILFIHKQTLVYRINRIEEILGKKLNNINNVSEIWIALRTAYILNLIPELS
jgi:PucR family transcriptional regulator, purine catabolism regulatory protein